MAEQNKRDFPASVTLTSDGGRIVQTNCFECHSKCGVLVYVDQNERVYKVTGNPADPQNKGTVCSKAQAAKEILYHPERVNYPLKRVGEKGEGKWERISWDEAMDTISSKLLAYKETIRPGVRGFRTGNGKGNEPVVPTIGQELWYEPLVLPGPCLSSPCHDGDHDHLWFFRGVGRG